MVQTGMSAQGVRWDLSDLYDLIEDSRIAADLKRAKEKAVAFEKKYRPLFEKIKNGEKGSLAPLLKEFIDVITLGTKPMVFAQLMFAAYTNSPTVGAFLQKMQLEMTEIRHSLRFWEIEWSALDEQKARAISSAPDVAPHRHYLENLRKYAPHLLSENEEKVIDIKDNSGVRAFTRLFDELINNIPFYLSENGNRIKKTEAEVLALLYSPDREKRREGHRSLTEGLRENKRMLTYIFNRIAEDHKSTNELRQFDHPMAPRNLANELTLPMVENLVAAVKSGYPLVERYYRLKKKLLGLETLYDYDRYAPVLSDLPRCSWNDCEKMVREAYHQFDPNVGKIIAQFFEKKWIDAEVREGKRGGAFCCETTPELHPYVFLNYTGRMRDVMTVAHELGHGLHQYLARRVGILESSAPLPLAETASVFGEILTFDKLMNQEQEPRVQLGLLCGKIEDMFATVFRQVVMTDFEQKLHAAVIHEGELSTEKISHFWIEANQLMHGQAVELTPEYQYWWMYIPHFIHTPFYCYAYSFAQLLVLSLYQKYKEDPGSFVPRFVEMLSLGGSRKPEEICGIVGVDIQDPAFWRGGLSLLDEMVSQAENLAVLQ